MVGARDEHVSCRATVHVLHRDEAASVCERTRASEGDEPAPHFGFWKAV